MRTYYKGLDENLCGRNGFQYEVGRAFTADTDDNWHWLYFTDKVTTAIGYGLRIVEVKPLTRITKIGYYSCNARTILIVRELSREEILSRLLAEGCCIGRLIQYKPTYEELSCFCRERFLSSDDCFCVCYRCDWLTAEQKKSLLPSCWHCRIDEQAFHEHMQEVGP